MKPRGYTLIEILVVVGIIAIIVAILFPVFATVRENGRMAKCISNLHQWGTAIQMYRDDWGGIDPAPGMKVKSFSELGFPLSNPFGAFEEAYGLDDTGVRYCPSAPMQHTEPHPYGKSFWGDAPYPDDIRQRLVNHGMDWPLMVCSYHNSPPLLQDTPTWATIRVVVLRLNQRVDVRRRKAWPINEVDW
ncbi:MAG: prepilin-type N-terminal cleavage/methylation domain-containing protein [Chthonomonadales bacterium]|nr:prepilin-type N-terminal cleavage/methylation domain-containing protein [Chthonomonadales bacterium]